MAITALKQSAVGKTFLGGARITTGGLLFERCIFDAQVKALYACEVKLGLLASKATTYFIECTFKNADKLLVGSRISVQGCTFEDGGNDGIFANGAGGEVLGNTFRRLGSIEIAKKIVALKGQIWDPSKAPHADGVQTNGYRAWRIVGNDFQLRPDAGHLTNSCVYAEAEFGDGDFLTVNGNRMDGGNNCVWAIDWKVGSTVKRRISKNVWIKNNQILSYRMNPTYAPTIPAANVTGNDASGAVVYK